MPIQTSKERAKSLFIKKIEEAENVDLKFSSLLKESFQDLVDIMPVNGMFAAARMAAACVAISQEAKNIETAIDDALAIYLSMGEENSGLIKRSNSPGESKEARAVTEEEANEIDPSRAEKRNAFIELNSQINLRPGDTNDELADAFDLVVPEHLDVLSDIPAEYLSIEGKRSRGLISATFDATTPEEPEEVAENTLRVYLPFSFNEYKEMVTKPDIKCPKCHSKDILFLYTNNCECLSCSAEFLIEFGEDKHV